MQRYARGPHMQRYARGPRVQRYAPYLEFSNARYRDLGLESGASTTQRASPAGDPGSRSVLKADFTRPHETIAADCCLFMARRGV